MFDFEDMRKNMKDEERLEEIRRAAVDMLFEMVLNDPEVPEDRKIGMRILKEAENASKKLQAITRTFGAPDGDDAASKKNYAVRREVLEYIRMVNAGIDAFLELHPAPPPFVKAN